MQDAPRQALVEVVQKYGPALADDQRRLDGLLRDYAGTYRREITVLVAAAREGIPRDLLDPQSGVPLELRLPRLIQRLEDNVAMSTDAARWAVESWAEALGLTVTVLVPPEPEPEKPAEPPGQPSVAPVSVAPAVSQQPQQQPQSIRPVAAPPERAARTVIKESATPGGKKPPPLALIVGGVAAATVVLVGGAFGLMQLMTPGTSGPPATATPTLAAAISNPPTAAPREPDLVAVPIRSNPNAGVFVNDESSGRTPLELRLKPGEYDLRLVASTYEEWTRRIKVDAGQPLSIPPVDLVPLATSKVINPSSTALGRDPFLDSGGIMRVATPTDAFRVGDDIQAIVYVTPRTNGIRDLPVDYVWRLDRAGGLPPSRVSGRQDIPSAWQQTFLRVCIPGAAADAAGSNTPVTLVLLVDDEPLESFTFRVGPGPLNVQSECGREVTSQLPT